MKVHRIQLESTRTFADLAWDIPQGKPVCVVGPNGLGKTNFLEALYVLSLSKPFRTNTFEDMIKEGEGHMSIVAQLENTHGKTRPFAFFGVAGKPMKKKYAVDGVEKSPSEFVGQAKMVLFHPEDISQFIDSPGFRRKVLNLMITQMHGGYFQHLMQYTNILKQRNALLRMIQEKKSSKNELAYWDDQLAEEGSAIVRIRRNMVEKLGPHMENTYKAISGKDDEVTLTYKAKKGTETKEGFLKLLEERIDRDVLYRQTSVGPHRDDVIGELRQKDILRFASRGEMRSFVLSLKLAQAHMIAEEAGEHPLLLLDDVFSELDPERQQNLLENTADFQTFITMTHMEDFLQDKVHQVTIEDLLGNRVL